MLFAITYDLNPAGQDYRRLSVTIEGLGDAIHPLQNLWFLHSSLPLDQIVNALLSVVDGNDVLFVTSLSHGSWYCNTRDQETANWINSRQ